MSSLAVIEPKADYDRKNEAAFREEVRKLGGNAFDRRADLVVPFGKRLAFTSAQGQTIFFGYNADGNFTIQQDENTPFGLASISFVSSVQSDLESSFATLEASLTADFGDLSASFTTIATAFADIETAFATLEVDVEAANDAAAAAATSALAAYASETAAGSSASAAATSATSAATQASNAATSASQASTSETNAAGSAATATTQASNAATSATNAGNSATAASGSASTASTQATNAANSASAASTSATSAATQASNAATSASAASTSAGAASTSASQASTSESNAAGSASAAATSASNAATSATSAGNSASAASTSASTASTQATNAGTSASNAATSASNAATSASAAGTSATAASGSASSASTSASNAATSASAASTSQVAASVSAATTVPATFSDASQWNLQTATISGGLFLSSGATNYGVAYGLGYLPLVSGHTYAVTARHRVTADGTNNYHYIGLYAYNDAGTLLGQYWNGYPTTAAEGWQTETATIAAAPVLAAYPTATRVVAAMLMNYNNVSSAAANATCECSSLALKDITESTTAAGSASAAASSASSAAASQSAAASSASAASTSATNAATQASNAATSASQASTSETNAAGSASSASTSATNAASSQSAAAGSATAASGSASTASTQATNAATSASAASTSATAAGVSATNASTSASTATTQASNASASAAAASSSATLSATYASGSQGSINSSATFADNAVASGVPTNWTNLSSGSGTRVTGIAPQPYAFQLAGTAGNAGSIYQDLTGKLAPSNWYVLEADVTLNSGALTGAGVILDWNTNGGTYGWVQLTFATDVDVSNAVVGAGTVGRLYRFRKLVQAAAALDITYIPRLIADSHRSTHGSIASANNLTWHRCAVRAASQAEIEARAATTALVTTNANVATNTSAIATETTARAAADTTLTAQIVSLRNVKLPNRPEVGDDFTTNTNTGTPGTWAALSVGTVVTAANEGSVRKFTDLQTFTTRSWLPVIAGHTYRMTHRGRVTADGTDNRIIAAFIAHDKDGAALATLDFHTADTAAVAADGWQTFTRDLTATSILASQPTTAYLRPRLSVNRNNAGTDSGADTEIAILGLEDVTTQLATDASIATNASAIATETSARTTADTILKASVAVATQAGVIRNPKFSLGLSSSLPLYWSNWNNGTNCSEVARDTEASAYCIRKPGGAGTNDGFSQTSAYGSITPGGKYLIRAAAKLTSGTYNGSGFAWYWQTSGGVNISFHNVGFANTADTAGVTSNSQTGVRVWESEVTAPATASRIVFYSMTHYDPNSGGNSVANSLDWYEADFIPVGPRLSAVEASVTTNASAIATINGAAAFWETIVAASGGDLAAVRLKAGASGSYLELISTVLRLANVSNGAIIEVMRAVSGEAYFSRPISSDSGSRRVTIGPGYGVSGQEVVLWFGPVATAPASQSRTNGYFALGTDGQVYYGAGALSTVTAYYGTHDGPAVASRTGAGYVTSGNVTITPVNGTAPFYYRYTMLENPNSISLNATNGVGNNTFSVNATISAAAIWRCNVAVDITDAIGRTTRVIVSDNELYDDT